MRTFRLEPRASSSSVRWEPHQRMPSGPAGNQPTQQAGYKTAALPPDSSCIAVTCNPGGFHISHSKVSGNAKKHQAERRRPWRKLYIGIDAQTLQLRAICVSSNKVSDAAVMPELLAQVPAQESLLTVTGDGPTTPSQCMRWSCSAMARPSFLRERMPDCA